MKKVLLVLGLFALSACEGVSTGQKSDCFGKTSFDGSYVTQLGFSPSRDRLSSKTQNGGNDDCHFENL